MDRDLQRGFAWWMMVLFCLYTVSEGRFPSNSQSGLHSRTDSGGIQPQATSAQQHPPVQLHGRPRPVVVRCHPDSLEVVVQADLFDTGFLVDVTHLRLGSESRRSDTCTPVPSGPDEFTIRAGLTDCGTKLSSTKEKIIYSNVLVYSLEPSSNGLLRLDGATIPVECHYEMLYFVEGISVLPTWVPFISRVTAEDKINFSLRIMTADWQLERGSYTYFLGDPVHLELSAIMGNHKPLRVFVDHCIATATPDTEVTLQYNFIEPNGCLADAYLTNSSSRFLPRIEQHKLRFQIDAFKFYKNPSNQVYITCHVTAVPVDGNVMSQRACSFIENRWISVDGNNEDCRSCELAYQVIEPPKTIISMRPRAPVASEENLIHIRPEQPASFVHVRMGSQHYPHSSLQSSIGPTKTEIGNEIEGTIQMRPLIVLPSSRTKKFHRRTGPPET